MRKAHGEYDDICKSSVQHSEHAEKVLRFSTRRRCDASLLCNFVCDLASVGEQSVDAHSRRNELGGHDLEAKQMVASDVR